MENNYVMIVALVLLCKCCVKFSLAHLRMYPTVINTHTRTRALAYLSDGAQQLPVAEHDHQERHDQAEDEQADDVGDAVGRLGRPVDRTGGPRTLRAVAAPAEERRHRPDQRVDPGQGDAQARLAVVGRVGLGRGHHGAVALEGQDRQRDQGHDSCEAERTRTRLTLRNRACV